MKLKKIWTNIERLFNSHKEQETAQNKVKPIESPAPQDRTEKQEQIKPVIQQQVNKSNEYQTIDNITLSEKDKIESIEEIRDSIGKLIVKLEVIENILNTQVIEQKKFIEHLSKIPELFNTFAAAAENQQRSQAQVSEQIKVMVSRDEQFLEAIEQIPQEEARQTETLSEIKKRLSISAETEAKMAECFRTFNETLKKLDADTAGQADSILQMSKTFATSDKYLRYVMGVQNKRFLWLFVISMGVCLVSVLTLAGIIIYLSV